MHTPGPQLLSLATAKEVEHLEGPYFYLWISRSSVFSFANLFLTYALNIVCSGLPLKETNDIASMTTIYAGPATAQKPRWVMDSLNSLTVLMP